MSILPVSDLVDPDKQLLQKKATNKVEIFNDVCLDSGITLGKAFLKFNDSSISCRLSSVLLLELQHFVQESKF